MLGIHPKVYGSCVCPMPMSILSEKTPNKAVQKNLSIQGNLKMCPSQDLTAPGSVLKLHTKPFKYNHIDVFD